MIDSKKLKKLCSNYSVLIVDDEENSLHYLNSILKSVFGYVQTATNGKDAFKKYKKEHFDLLITDINMPIMNGFDLINKIREIDLTQRIIILSADNEASSLIKGIKYSVDGYIFKPLDAQQMIEVIKKALNYITLERENKQYKKILENIIKDKDVELKKYSKKVIQQLQYDQLTKLPNKQKLQLDFKKKIFKELILINIDNFQNINVAYGFDYGDIVIQSIATFLSDVTSKCNIYHIFGDEFIIAIKNKSDFDASTVAQEIKKSLYSKSFVVKQTTINLSFTYGIVKLKHETEVPYNKLSIAIKDVREIGKNKIGFYHKESNIINRQKDIQSWSRKIKIALDLDLIEPVYQMIYDFNNEKVYKYESLVRIYDSDGYISPAQFLESAKIHGCLTKITRRMIDKVFAKFQSSSIHFSINITDDDLKENYLIDYLINSCDKFKIEPKNITLEVLENISNYDTKDAIEQINELRALGFKIAIDDFGYESSNFQRVQNLSVDYIKIDGNFIKDIDTNENSRNITSTIIYYAKKSGLKSVAEFVHSKEVYDEVKKLGVDYIQGYYIHEPTSCIDMEQ